ncbi:hypothetical protein HRJ35_05685 [Shewanella oneidensis MR-1]|uniref:Mu phage uncharacterized protein n=1 Tax=Shewanella oneidensis (strain ATCC 700550 / JCM 31522 / CIP 106686 / LMG 19005 / NCIMB 14063 / MR-1) TaxID=211586 RepID=Q8EJ19_SHEON|nr:hypothetical protein [Shewanella oneidensis]AAN53732.1 Mu phage uncharacterized protein [Shewanella oneidensis MR-1]MDX5997424.1 hypothetical protein [Shewanella oneidensis]MEE2028007.1 hypothetical protein [Shewanella oneidensis]QKG95540.1 hypothetical protein HRJ35_05685 [Shewanella oneidensis MR-1]
MKKILLIIIIAAIAYVLMPVTVNGTLYVVTNSANVVTMPITSIKVYPLKEFREALYQKQNFANQQCMGLPDKSEAEVAYLSGGPNRENAKANYELIVSCETATLIKEINMPLVETIQTNKDGEFNLSRSRLDELVLVAEGKRRVVGETEEYLWLRVIPKEGVLSQKLEINNGNLVNDIKIQAIQL